MTDCVLPSRPHRAEAGLLICRRHLDELADALHEVQAEAEVIDARPSMAQGWGEGGGGGGLKSTKSPVRLDAVVLGDHRVVDADEVGDRWGADPTLSAFGVLHTWANRVRNGKDIALPTRVVTDRVPGRAGPLCAFWEICQHSSCRFMRYRYVVRKPLDIRSERALLTRHLEWAAFQPWIDECFAQVTALRSQLQALNGTAPPPPLPGRCPRLDEGLVECGGSLWPAHRPGLGVGDAAIPTADGAVRSVQCGRDPDHHWEGRELAQLALVVQRQQQQEGAA